jgi:hypothetical protein
MNSEKYIGLDVHQATISVAVLDSTGKLIMESILETKKFVVRTATSSGRVIMLSHVALSIGSEGGEAGFGA